MPKVGHIKMVSLKIAHISGPMGSVIIISFSQGGMIMPDDEQISAFCAKFIENTTCVRGQEQEKNAEVKTQNAKSAGVDGRPRGRMPVRMTLLEIR